MATLKDPVTGRHTMGMSAKNDFTVNSRLKVGGATLATGASLPIAKGLVTVAAGPVILTPAQTLGGYISVTAGGPLTISLPTADNLNALADIFPGEFYFIPISNASGGVVTIASAGGGTGLGGLTIANAVSGLIFIHVQTEAAYNFAVMATTP